MKFLLNIVIALCLLLGIVVSNEGLKWSSLEKTFCAQFGNVFIVFPETRTIFQSSLFETDVFDVNIFRCMWKKDYTCPHSDIIFFMYTP